MSFSDGVKTSAWQQNNVRFSILCHYSTILCHPLVKRPIFLPLLCSFADRSDRRGSFGCGSIPVSSARCRASQGISHLSNFKGADPPLGETTGVKSLNEICVPLFRPLGTSYPILSHYDRISITFPYNLYPVVLLTYWLDVWPTHE